MFKNFDWRSTIGPNIKTLRLVGLWPKDYNVYEYDLYLLYSVVSVITIFGGHNLSQVINIYYVYNDLEALSATIFLVATNLAAILKRRIFVKNLQVIKNSFRLLNSEQFQPRNQGQMILIQDALKMWKIIYFALCSIAYVNVSMWLLVPILNGWTESHILPFKAWYPFNTDISPNYEVAYAYQVVCIYFITVSILNMDAFISANMVFIGAQCDILSDELKNFKNEPNYNEKLKACINYHQEILSFSKRSNDFFNYIILGQMAASTTSLALALFQFTLSDASAGSIFASFLYVFGMCAQILSYCWFGNEVEVKSSRILYAIYESEWIGQKRDSLKNLLIFCINCHSPIKITAINLLALSLSTFLKIIRSAWSYFALLSTVNKRNA